MSTAFASIEGSDDVCGTDSLRWFAVALAYGHSLDANPPRQHLKVGFSRLDSIGISIPIPDATLILRGTLSFGGSSCELGTLVIQVLPSTDIITPGEAVLTFMHRALAAIGPAKSIGDENAKPAPRLVARNEAIWSAVLSPQLQHTGPSVSRKPAGSQSFPRSEIQG